jgi:Cys-Gly metallodipeptidase DUG1
MGHWLADQIKALGGTVELRELGKQPGREHLDLPPCLLGRYGNDPKKVNVLVYGHYDVQPANKSDGWATDPFTLSIDDKGRMFGRGSTDDKGPVLRSLASPTVSVAATTTPSTLQAPPLICTLVCTAVSLTSP